MRRSIAAILALLALLLIGGELERANAGAGDAIAAAVEGMDSGRLRFQFAAREGVMGDGHSIITHSDDDDDDWHCDCEEGPVRVRLRVHKGRVSDVRTRVGGEWGSLRADDVDLGMVTPEDAAAYLLRLARTGKPSAAEDAILPATLADGVETWPALLEIARERSIDSEVRQNAIFWLGQSASAAAVEGLDRILEDDDSEIEIREQAVFALSQRPERESVPRLMEVARSNRHPQLRENAMFWLAQLDDPRVLEFFEEILAGD